MKRLPVLLLTTACCFAACMKDGTWTKACQLSTGLHTAPGDAKIMYEITGTGSVFVNHAIYYDAGNPIKVDKPTLPFVLTLPVQAADTIGLQVEGRAMEGRLQIRHRFIMGTDTVTTTDACAG
ncbi:hypothetical protein [Paraflavitalea pollutisoli]|uniref:hypothetical protein n=1 Tax=Paraflavitalea pollutisoli TaxID=3034143 RepID=UPI0023ED47E4|nr:hypothetical protein [Paraflavitalea sp. H1-2-19X]